MTQEEKVRNAVKVADELVSTTTRSEHAYVTHWQDVFSAMLRQDYIFNNMTATGAELMRQHEEMK